MQLQPQNPSSKNNGKFTCNNPVNSDATDENKDPALHETTAHFPDVLDISDAPDENK